jgi:O-antigen/teichoic acid export membrane protein
VSQEHTSNPVAEPLPAEAAEAAANAEGLDSSPGAKALRGVPWTLLGFAATRGFSLIGTVVVARLVPPDQIGVVLTGLIVVNYLNLLSDNGMGPALVVREKVDARFAGTVLTSMLSIAVIGAAVAALAAHPLADLFGEPRLAKIMPWLAWSTVLVTGTYFFSSYLQREMLFRRRFIGQLTLAVTYVVATVTSAALGAGLWSLVIGQLSCGLLAFAVLWVITPHRPRPRFHVPSFRAAWHESRQFMSQAVTQAALDSIPFVAVASLLGPRPIALLNMGYRLGELPVRGISIPVAEATYPAFSRMRDSDATRALLTSLKFVLLAGIPFLVTIATLAGPFREAVLGPQWAGLEPTLRILCVWALIALPANVLNWYVNANGGARYQARVNLVRLAVVGTGIFVAAANGASLELIACFVVLDATLDLVFVSYYCHSRLAVRVGRLVAQLSRLAAAAAVLAGVGLAAEALFTSAGLPSGAVLVLSGTVALAAFAGAMVFLDRGIVIETRDLLQRALART